jgi:RNA polymerase sigma factor (sigma-70 family)
MRNDDLIPNLAERLRAGDPEAPEALFRRYARQLARLADQHLNRKFAGRVDAEDVVQSVFRTFFRRSARGEFRIDDSAQVWRLLVTLTVRKAQVQARRHGAHRRDAGREVVGEAPLTDVLGREPGPEDAAVLMDEIASLLRGLPNLHCHVLERRLEGQSVADIAAALDVSRQTVYRVLKLLQQRLERASIAVAG